MNPYAKPAEKKIGTLRPRFQHLAPEIDSRTRAQRQSEKQAVIAERRAIKKSARRHLQNELHAELDDAD